jgi:peptide chain release factor 1
MQQGCARAGPFHSFVQVFMATVPNQKLDRLVERWHAVQEALSAGPDQETFVKLSKEFAELDPVVGIIRRLRDAERERRDLASIIDDPQADKDMVELAYSEIPMLDERVEEAMREISQRVRARRL